MKLPYIITEIVIPMGEHKTVFSSVRAIVRIEDEGSGPYLMISGKNDEPDAAENETGNEFFLQSVDEINQFAVICKKMMVDAQKVSG